MSFPSAIRYPLSDITRRDLFSFATRGLAATALTDLLLRDQPVFAGGLAAEARGTPHHDPKCTRVIQIFLCGGMSHLDSFDYKPLLEKYHGKPLPSSETPETFFGKIGLLRKNDWNFRQR